MQKERRWENMRIILAGIVKSGLLVTAMVRGLESECKAQKEEINIKWEKKPGVKLRLRKKVIGTRPGKEASKKGEKSNISISFPLSVGFKEMTACYCYQQFFSSSSVNLYIEPRC